MVHCVSFLDINKKFQIVAEIYIGGDTVQNMVLFVVKIYSIPLHLLISRR